MIPIIKPVYLHEMDYFHRKYRGLRYKVDYLVIDYKQRYYSNHRDPRIIQGKLGDSPFISLRMFPQDKYMVRIGEFLTLTRKGEEKEEGDEVQQQQQQEQEEDQSNCETDSVTDVCLISSPIMYHPRSVSLPEELNKYSSEEANNSEVTTATKTNIIQRLYKNYQDEILIPTKASFKSPKSPKSLKSPITSKFSCGTSTTTIDPPPEVWKSVLNDISLHAARIPYGAPPKSRQDYTNLTSDFISKANNNKQKSPPKPVPVPQLLQQVPQQQENINYAQLIDTISYQYNENDVFTLNYQDGKTNYLSCKLTHDDYDLLYDYESYNI